ncbi:hypothetical protein [Roseibium aggregatum]|uniref:Uncharacterized protein n=1 Tax=Roseibium aggregatum TaxID=187304 RepID=A0A939EA99_9HYPH|nr:hypothetical protein [Roseibium aggregatum]MBN9669051.1 hypothetical protein [Roseibium aggregatum]
MLVTVVLAAEVLVAVWFAVFSLMLLSMYLDSRSLPVPRLDIAGRTLIDSAKFAFLTGIAALAVMTVMELPFLR